MAKTLEELYHRREVLFGRVSNSPSILELMEVEREIGKIEGQKKEKEKD